MRIGYLKNQGILKLKRFLDYHISQLPRYPITQFRAEAALVCKPSSDLSSSALGVCGVSSCGLGAKRQTPGLFPRIKMPAA